MINIFGMLEPTSDLPVIKTLQRSFFDYVWETIKRRANNELILFDVPVEIDGKSVPQDLRIDLIQYVKGKFKSSKLICLWPAKGKYVYDIPHNGYDFKTDSLNTLSSSAIFAISRNIISNKKITRYTGEVDSNYIDSLLT